MWKANGKTTTLQLFLDSLLSKKICEVLRLEISSRSHSLDNSVWKRLWACRETDKYLNLNIVFGYLAAPPVSTLDKVSSLASGSLVGQGAQEYSA
jgi:hypothetical protein